MGPTSEGLEADESPASLPGPPAPSLCLCPCFSRTPSPQIN